MLLICSIETFGTKLGGGGECPVTPMQLCEEYCNIQLIKMGLRQGGVSVFWHTSMSRKGVVCYCEYMKHESFVPLALFVLYRKVGNISIQRLAIVGVGFKRNCPEHLKLSSINQHACTKLVKTAN